MKSLFIIGNGFDLSHGIPTSYENFHQYLVEEYPDANGEDLILPFSTTSPDGGEEFDDDEVVSFLLHIISEAEPYGDKWSDLETSLGILDFDSIFDTYEDDDEEDDNEWHEVYRNEDLSSFIYYATGMIMDYFSDWISTLYIDETIISKKDFQQLIDVENDYFLTFNYTDTLEQVYDAKNVCHIHGNQGEKLLLGHANSNDYYEYNMLNHVGAENTLQELQNLLRKDTNYALKKNSKFFKELNSIDKIYSYGFSFAIVDQIYLKKICEFMTTDNIEWLLNDFDSSAKRKDYEIILRNCGFKGKISTYHIEK